MSEEKLMLDVGQANELKLAFRRTGWTNDEIKKLCQGNMLADVLSVIRKEGRIETKIVIDCNNPPTTMLLGTYLEKHIKLGNINWSPNRLGLRTTYAQDKEGIIGTDLLKGLEELDSSSKCVSLNICFIQFILDRPYLIPEAWYGASMVCFWGSIFIDSTSGSNDLFVPYIYHVGVKWHCDIKALTDTFYRDHPAAIYKISNISV